MSKFDLSKKRKVKRKNQTSPIQRQQLNLELISISEKWPPQNDTHQILTWENEFGWFISNSELIRQHIKADIQMFGHSRVRYWTFLE